MTRNNNQNTRAGNRGSSNQPAEPSRRHRSGGHMGAGRSGSKSMGSEKPEHLDNLGSRRPEDADEFGSPDKK